MKDCFSCVSNALLSFLYADSAVLEINLKTKSGMTVFDI